MSNAVEWSGFTIQKGKSFIVIVRVVDESVVGKDYTLCAAAVSTEGVYVTLGPFSALCVGELPLVVAEVVAADAFAGTVGLK